MFNFSATGTPITDFSSVTFNNFWIANETYIYWLSGAFLSMALVFAILLVFKEFKKTKDRDFR